MDIFVSHSRKDANFTSALVNLLRVALRLSAEQIRATSVEATQLEVGADIDEKLRAEVRDSPILIAVLSPNSLASTYVLFELEARWGAEKKMLPILMPGMSSEQLAAPLNRLNVRMSNRGGLLNLIEQIPDTLQIRPERPESYDQEIVEVLQKKPAHIEPLAYAVLSYVLDSNRNFALLKDPHYQRIQPPGRRLKSGEQPHEVALSIASIELDLPIEELKRLPPTKEIRYANTRLVPPPFQVQLERNPHREAVLHYDFVYVFTIDRDCPDLNVRDSTDHKFEPRWYSLQDVGGRQKDTQWVPHEDMVPTMRRILDLEKS